MSARQGGVARPAPLPDRRHLVNKREVQFIIGYLSPYGHGTDEVYLDKPRCMHLFWALEHPFKCFDPSHMGGGCAASPRAAVGRGMDDMAQHASRDRKARRRSGDSLRLRILDAIEAYQREHGRPPTIREIGVQVGIAAPSHVRYHVTKLEEEGYLTREAGSSRSLVSTRPSGVRVLGTIAAGEPLDLFDDDEPEWLELGELGVALPPVAGLARTGMKSGTGSKEIYALRVRGTSMIEDGILNGDFVLIAPGLTVANGAIAVVLHRRAHGDRGAVTLKRVFRSDEGVCLQPANADLEPRVIAAEEWDREWRVQGRVVAVYRRYAP